MTNSVSSVRFPLTRPLGRRLSRPLSAVGRRIGSDPAWSPGDLFVGGRLGAWYEFRPECLFADTARTTPIAGPGSTVAAIADLSPHGAHQSQATSSKRGIYGRESLRARVNLLEQSNVFSNAWWTKSNGTISTVDGVQRLTAANQTNQPTPRVLRNNYLANSTIHTLTAEVRRGNYDFVMLTSTTSNSNFPNYNSCFNLTTKTWISTGGNIISQSHTDLEDGWIRLRVTLTTSAGSGGHGFAIRLSNAGGESGSMTFAGTEYVELRNCQVELGSTATAYQNITTTWDITEAGQPTLHYLQLDGVDDTYASNSISWNTGKVTTVAAIKKQANQLGFVAGTDNALSSQGFRLLAAGNTDTQQDQWQLFLLTLNRTTTAPNKVLYTGLGDMASYLKLRKNKESSTPFELNQTSGNFSAAPIRLGSLQDSSRYFAGRYYGLLALGDVASPENVDLAEGHFGTLLGI